MITHSSWGEFYNRLFLESCAMPDYYSLCWNCNWQSLCPSSTNCYWFHSSYTGSSASKDISWWDTFQLLSIFPNKSCKEVMYWKVFMLAPLNFKKERRKMKIWKNKRKERGKVTKITVKISLDIFTKMNVVCLFNRII